MTGILKQEILFFVFEIDFFPVWNVNYAYFGKLFSPMGDI